MVSNMTAMPQAIISTPEDYLRLESDAVDKHEWIDGRVLSMAGGSFGHSLATSNVIRCVGNKLVGKPCRTLDSNIRVRVATGGLYTYPDVTVVCGEPQFDTLDRSGGTLLNPRVIVEVLSPSTEAYDRGEKFRRYRLIESLDEYVLISQTEAVIEVFTKQSDGAWQLSTFEGADAVARLGSIQIDLPLREIYAGVTFAAVPPTGS